MSAYDSLGYTRHVLHSSASGGAKIVAIAVMDRMRDEAEPEGFCYVQADHFDRVLGVNNARSRRNYLGEAERLGLITYKPAGVRGYKCSLGGELLFRYRVLNEHPTERNGQIPSSAKTAPEGIPSSAKTAPEGIDVVVVEVVDREPPIVPHEKFALEHTTSLVITEDPFDGFRSALKDYLMDRVPTGRQYAYLRTVQSWVQMAKPPFNELMKEKQWRTMVAAAINKLLALPAAEEPKIYASAKGVIGSPDTLRNAIRYELTQTQKEVSRVTGSGQYGQSRAPARIGVHSRDPREVLGGLDD